ncbi:hypothetical protein B0T22DRAFT_513498 [Podospora appendiculata]|uniref:FAD-binding domain-containing protein n=1 Tax=Podospora appendiculata TaxID=314037 RepID=A0AAE0XAW2_9PEZI|nr:hypothetical protein B0T22DRAFT_513498 [Podospora appendiculata]
MTDNKFKVIVVGGGPVGLMAAHALSQADIDFIILEYRDSAAPDVGASVALWPQALRVMGQLGLLPRLATIGTLMDRNVAMTLDGHKFKENHVVRYGIGKNHGASTQAYHRADLLQALYDSLTDADKARMLTKKQVTNITTTDDGVEVHCADGTTYRGSILIGADGIHSIVHKTMRTLALESFATTAPDKINDEHPFLAEYRCMWCSIPRQPDFLIGDFYEIHGTDMSLQCLVGRERSWRFIYERLPTPTRERVTYTQSDVEALAARAGEHAASLHCKVKDVFPTRHAAGMANLEEGVLPHWSWRRIVLVGDACHKQTPNSGLGFNNGIQDVVALVNELHRAVKAHEGGGGGVGGLDVDALGEVFARYQQVRREPLKKDMKFATMVSRMSAWRTWSSWLLDRYIFPSIPEWDMFMARRVLAKDVSACLVFDFVEAEEPFEGTVPLKHAMPSPGVKKAPV